jgi:hypothetical protein
VLERRRQRRLVAEAARQGHDLHALVGVGEVDELGGSAVAAAVIHDHELEPHVLERGRHTGVKGLDCPFLVVHRGGDRHESRLAGHSR